MISIWQLLIAATFISSYVYCITDWQKLQNSRATNQPPEYLPNFRHCYCIPIKNCQPFVELLLLRPIHPLAIEFLRNQTCGFVNKDPYVCCNEEAPKFPQPRTKEKCMVTKNPEDNELDPRTEIPTFDTRFRKPPYRGPRYPPRFYPFRPYPNVEHESPYFYPHKFHGSQENFDGKDDDEVDFPYYFGEDKWNHYDHGKSDSPTEMKSEKESSSESSTTSTTTSVPEVIGNNERTDIVNNSQNVTPLVDTVINNKTDELENGSLTRSRLLPDDTCGLSLDERVIGGTEVQIGSFPWMARLGYTRPRSSEYLYRCGGTLINSRFVITAAHCTTNLPRNLTLATIRLGELDERTNPDCLSEQCADLPQDFKPILVIVHSRYDQPKFKNDISLVKLEKEAQITPYVSPICLPYNLMKPMNMTGMDAFTAGWGIANIDRRISSPVLQQATLRISDTSNCAQIYSTRFQLNVDESQLCTSGPNGQDACEGDSGGPLMRRQLYEGVPRYFLFGVVSFGPTQCGKSGLPSVFTKITNYLDWIMKHLED